MKKQLVQASLILLLGLTIVSGCKSSKPEEKDTSAEDHSQIKLILTNLKKASDQPAGWELIKSDTHRCQIGLPEGSQFKGKSAIIFQNNGPSFTIEVTDRDASISPHKYAEDVEKFLRGFDPSVFSQSIEPVDGVYLHSFANQSANFYQLARIYVTDDRVYVLTCNADKGRMKDPGIAYFFDSFELLDKSIR